MDLLLYVWLGEFWLASYSLPDYPGDARKVRRLLRFHPISLFAAVLFMAAAWFYKKHFALPEYQAGFPGYFLFLVVGAPASGNGVFSGGQALHFINWRALSLTLFFMALLS